MKQYFPITKLSMYTILVRCLLYVCIYVCVCAFTQPSEKTFIHITKTSIPIAKRPIS